MTRKGKQLACLIQEDGQDALFLMFNAGPHGAEFSLPPLPLGFLWHLAIDTSRSAPQDLSAAGEETLVDNSDLSSGVPLQRDPSGTEAGSWVGRRFHMSQRASGILLHPTSLSNPYPIGDLGPAAIAFVDFMVESGQRWWQMLPIGPAGGDNSPYRSPSAFCGNPLLMSPDRLLEQGLLGRQDIELPVSRGDGKGGLSRGDTHEAAMVKKGIRTFRERQARWQAI